MSETASRSFAVSVAALAGVRLIGVVSGFGVSVIGARLLDQAAFGAAGVAITVGMVAALVGNAGVNIATIYLAGRLPERRDAVLGATATIAAFGALVAVVAVAAAGVTLGGALKVPGRVDLFGMAAVVGVGIIGFEYGGAVLLALARRRSYAGIELVRSVVALAATLVLVSAIRTDAAFVLAAGLAYVGAAGIALGIGRRASGALRPAWHPELMRRGLALGLRGQAGNVLQFLNLRLDLLLIPVLLQLSAAGLYLVAVRISEALTQVANAAGSLIFPAVAADADPGASTLTERTVRLSLLIVIAAALTVAVVARPLLVAAFGAEYGPADVTLRILAIAMIPLSLTRILAGDLKGRGRPGLVSLAMLVALVLTVVLNLLLIPVLGIAGAALASLVAYSASAGVLVVSFASLTGSPPHRLLPGPSDALVLLRAARAMRPVAR